MNNRIITISREYGSGGRAIGHLVAEKLGVPYYDKELIRLVASESGFSSEYVEGAGEHAPNSLLFNFAMAPVYCSTFSQDILPNTDKLFVAQSRVITGLAEKGPCVIVGRCADYILREREDCLNVFIHADMESRVQRAVSKYSVPAADAEDELRKKDKARANHYKRYTGQIWGAAKNYHMTLNSGKLGLNTCVELILQAARAQY
jgi:cytidylate kinase